MQKEHGWASECGLIAVIGFALAAPAAGQANPSANNVNANTPQFEVATIKPHPEGDRTITIGGKPGRYEATNVTARMLVEEGFGVPSDQVSGGLDWTTTQHFDVAGKIPDAEWQAMTGMDNPHRGQQMQLMLQSLLKERFRLEIRHESRELQVYALVLARGGAHLPAAKTKRATSGAHSFVMAMMNDNGSMGELAQFLEGHFGRTVLDQTGLKGNYNITLEVPMPEDYVGGDTDSLVIEALRDQMGLKLESRKAIVDTIVVEHMELPGEN